MAKSVGYAKYKDQIKYLLFDHTNNKSFETLFDNMEDTNNFWFNSKYNNEEKIEDCDHALHPAEFFVYIGAESGVLWTGLICEKCNRIISGLWRNFEDESPMELVYWSDNPDLALKKRNEDIIADNLSEEIYCPPPVWVK